MYKLFRKRFHTETAGILSDFHLKHSDIKNNINTFFMPAGCVYKEKIYCQNYKSYKTAVQILRTENNEFAAYSLNHQKKADINTKYIKSVDNNGLSPEIVSKLRYIINSTYPFVTDISLIEKKSGIENLTKKDIIAATQCIIWETVSGNKMHLQNNKNSKNMLLFYKYLSENIEDGLTKNEIIKNAELFNLTVDDSKMKQESRNNYYIYGPLKITSENENSFITDIRLSEPDNKVSFFYENGKALKTVELGNEFYFKLPKKYAVESVSVLCKSTAVIGADIDIAVSGKNGEKYQSFGICKYILKSCEASLKIYFCNVKVLNNTEKRSEYINGSEFLIQTDKSKLLERKSLENNSKPLFNNLLSKKVYKLIQTASPYPYLKLDNPIIFGTRYPEVTLTVKNKKLKCRILLISVSKNNINLKLPEAVFNIYKHDIIIDSITSDANGIAISKPLSEGEYEIVQSNAPDGYYLNNSVVSLNLKNSECIKNIKAFRFSHIKIKDK